jgi:HPt (histidine-containing phosphotransfer) domain-containing protein
MMVRERNFDGLASIMDVASALDRLGGDVELLDQIILIFLEDAPMLVHATREALAAGNTGELRRAAHSLKGMMATLIAREGANAAFRLEQCAARGDAATASPLIHECGEHVAQISAALHDYCRRSGVENYNSAGSPKP